MSAWQDGFNAYCDGKFCDSNQPKQWQDGWWSALKAQAEAEFVKKAEEEAQDYEEDIEDREFFSRGQW